MPTISVARRTSPSPSDHARAQFSTRWLWPAIAVTAIRGDLDASNAADLSECDIGHSGPRGRLILDMTAVDFFGACCFACLHTVNVRCAGQNIDWVLIPSPAVSRILRICDPERVLPVSSAMPAALSKLRNHPLQLQLVNLEH